MNSNLLHEFFNSSSDACPLEATQQEALEKAFKEWYEDKVKHLDPFEQAVRPLMKYMAENQHPHTTVIVDSTSVQLLEGKQVYNTNEFIVD